MAIFKGMKDLKIALVQSPLFWEDPMANIEMFEKKILGIGEEIDLILLPETFTTGFSMKKVAELADSMEGNAINWMKKMSATTGAVICGSVMIAEGEKNYNRLLWVEPNGNIEHYDKRHLFRLAYEQNYFTPGAQHKIVNLHGWKINLNVCYDLRFPVWCRNRNLEYDVSLFVANWPEPRILHWDALLKARAIENLSYVVACNRIGIDGTGMNHTGHSTSIAPDGTVLNFSDKEEIIYTTLVAIELDKTRKRFAFYKDADAFELLKG